MEKAAQHYAENQVLESRNTESQKIEDKIKNVISKLMTDHTREMEKLNREHDQEREKMLDKCIDLDSARETAELKAIKLEEQLVEMEKDIIATKHQLAVAVGTSHEVGQSDDLDTVQEKEPSRYMDALELAIFSGEWSLVKTASAQLRVRIASDDKKINIAQQEVAAEVHLLHTQAARANATAEAMARSIWEERKTEVKAVTKWSVMSEIVP